MGSRAPRPTSSRLDGVEVEDLRRAASASRRAGRPTCRAHSGPRRGAEPRRAARRARVAARLRSSSRGRTARRRPAGMVAFCLAPVGPRPGMADRRPKIPQLGGQCGGGRRLARRRRRRVRPDDRRTAAPVAVVTNIDLDHHSTFGISGGGRGAVRRWLAGCPRSCAAMSLTLLRRTRWRFPGEHNRRNAALRGRRPRACVGVHARGGRSPRSPSSQAPGGGWSSAVSPAASRCSTTTRITRQRLRATLARRSARRRGRSSARPVPAASLLPHASSRTPARRCVVGGRRRCGHGRVPGARTAGPRCKAESSSSMRSRNGVPACTLAWTPAYDDGAHFLAHASHGAATDVLTIGAGDVDCAAPAVAGAPPLNVEQERPALAFHDAGHRRSCGCARTT